MITSSAMVLTLLVLFAADSAAQARATGAEQIAIEVAAAQYIAQSKPLPARGFVLDRRSYVLPVDVDINGSMLHGKPASEIPISHTSEHLEVIRSALSLAGITETSDKCPAETPTICRLATFPGLVAFGIASVHGTRAQISVSMWSRDDDPRTINGLRETSLHVSLESTQKGVWRVTRVRTSIS